MELLLSAEFEGQPDEAELRSLLDWLSRESPRPWRAELAPAVQQPDTMGGWADTLHVALGAGGAGGALLAHSLSAWIRTRRGGVRVSARLPDGTEFVIDAELRDTDGFVTRLTGVADQSDD